METSMLQKYIDKLIKMKLGLIGNTIYYGGVLGIFAYLGK